jgi:hypothetical protein
VVSRFAALIAGLAIALAAVGVATADRENGELPGSTTLTGANELPGPGDPNTTSAGHIPVAPVGASRPVAVPLRRGTDGGLGCAQNVDPSAIKAIHKHPSASYVKVHCTRLLRESALHGVP